MTTVNTSGKLAYMYDQDTDTWYSVSGAVNTTAAYNWVNSHTFNSTVIFKDVVKAEAGINNFQNPSERDSVLTAPSNGTVCFVRQENSGLQINQVQYYFNGSWRYVNDGYQIDAKIDNYTISVADAGKAIIINSASDRVVTIPTNTSEPFAIGQRVDVIRYGLGLITIVASAGVILNSVESKVKLREQFSACKLIKTGTDTWLLAGDLN
jgi:uncharacterized membrane protein